MTDGTIDALTSAARLIGGHGDRDDAAAVVHALAVGERRLSEIHDLRRRLARAERDLRACARERDALSDQLRAEAVNCRTSLGDGCVALHCGARLLIEKGYPSRLHDGDPHAQFREERRALALEEASAVWGERLEVVGAWGDDGEVEIELGIPF